MSLHDHPLDEAATPAMNPTDDAAITLQVLGPLKARRAGVAIELGVRREQAVLAWLAAEARPVARHKLAAWLWPDAEEADARSRLRRLLHSLASRLDAQALQAGRLDVALSPRLLAGSDLGRLRALLAAGLYRDVATLDAAAIEGLQEAAELARAEFAEGLQLAECDELSGWLERQRESLREARKQVLARLSGLHEGAGRFERALQAAREHVDVDPLDEPAQRRLMQLLAAAGHTAAALQQFERSRTLLREQLGVEPDAATLSLAARLHAQLAAAVPQPTHFEPQPVHYARNGDVHLAWTSFGAGPRDLLFISGFVSHLDQAWDAAGPAAFFAELARTHRVILFDRRGVGLSDRTVDPANLDDGVSDALAVLDAAGSRRATVFAVSEGGSIGVRLALERPQRVAGLALFGTLAKGSAADDYPWALPLPQLDRWLEQITAQWGQSAAIEVFAGPLHARDEGLRRWWARTLRLASSPRCMRAVLRSLALSDVRELLGSVRVPTVVMHREGDRAVRQEAARRMAEAIPGARWLPLPGQAHWWWLDDCRPVLEAIRALPA